MRSGGDQGGERGDIILGIEGRDQGNIILGYSGEESTWQDCGQVLPSLAQAAHPFPRQATT